MIETCFADKQEALVPLLSTILDVKGSASSVDSWLACVIPARVRSVSAQFVTQYPSTKIIRLQDDLEITQISEATRNEKRAVSSWLKDMEPVEIGVVLKNTVKLESISGPNNVAADH